MESTKNNQKSPKGFHLSADWRHISKVYKLTKVIGEGSFGQVVKAKHRENGSVVAIKFVKDDPSDIISCRNMLREISILSQLSEMKENTYTTQLLDIVIAGKDQTSIEKSTGLFIVMEFTDQDLSSLVNNSGSFDISFDHVIVIMYNILNAVNFIHSAGVMHRDLKPANILIDMDCQVQICDFGLSRCEVFKRPIVKDEELKSSDKDLIRNDSAKAKAGSSGFHQKRLSQNIGSRWYRSPEIILVQESYDSQIDVWSIGCIFAELVLSMLHGKRKVMFEGTSCFPISKPQNTTKSSDKLEKDQLKVILQTLGK